MSPLVLPPQSYLGWKVSIIILHAIAVSTTIVRLVHRFLLRRTWWDDYILFFPFAFNLAYWVLFCWGFSQPPGDNVQDDDLTFKNAIFNSYWLSTFPGILIWWGTRVVLALSLARLFPSKHPARRWSFILTGVLTLLCVVAIAVTIAMCDVSSALLNQGENSEQCIKGAGGFSMRNMILFAEVLGSDVMLAAFASTLIWGLTYAVIQYRIAVTVLSASLITLLYTTAFLIIIDTRVVSMGRDAVLIETGLHNILTAISLFLCNLPVIVAYFSGWMRHSPFDESTSQTVGVSKAQSTSYYSEPITPLTLTEISEVASSRSRQSGLSFGSMRSSWHASQEAGYSRSDGGLSENHSRFSPVPEKRIEVEIVIDKIYS